LQELNEVVYVAKSILIVVVDPSTLSAQELGLLEKEMKKVEAKYQVELDKDLFEILMFVKSENESGRFPAHKDVAHSFGITRPTAIKRIKELKNRGYIVDRRRGKFKIIELTERGKAIL
jgi:DNA-binding MarR family transcriptional regulator